MESVMTLPMDIKLKSLLTKKAKAEGVEVEQYAVETLRRVAELPTISELFADVGAAFVASGKTDEELRSDIEFALAEVRAERRAK